MKNKLNIVFCGTTNEIVDKSWGKTNSNFLNQLKQDANVVAVIDYGIKNVNKKSNTNLDGQTLLNYDITFDRKGKMIAKIVGFSPAIQKELDVAVEQALNSN